MPRKYLIAYTWVGWGLCAVVYSSELLNVVHRLRLCTGSASSIRYSPKTCPLNEDIEGDFSGARHML